MRIVALAGGTGAAKLLRGLDALVPPGTLTIIGNTGDDALIWGLHVSPDLDVNHPILPMSDQAVRTRVLGPDGWLSFQEYFVREKTQVEVAKVDYAGAPAAAPAPGVV